VDITKIANVAARRTHFMEHTTVEAVLKTDDQAYIIPNTERRHSENRAKTQEGGASQPQCHRTIPIRLA
jgi:hypothetical protein